MALSEEKILAIQIDYELGKLSKTQICKNHRISRPTLRKHASEGEWIYQKSFNEVSNEVRARVTEKIIERSSEEIIRATDEYLKKSKHLQDFSFKTIGRFEETIDFNLMDAQTADAIHRVIEKAQRIITNLYAFDRKALGLDIEADVEKARRVKKAEEPTERHDPTENLSEDEVDKLLEDMDG